MAENGIRKGGPGKAGAKKCPVDTFLPVGESINLRTHPFGCGLIFIIGFSHTLE